MAKKFTNAWKFFLLNMRGSDRAPWTSVSVVVLRGGTSYSTCIDFAGNKDRMILLTKHDKKRHENNLSVQRHAMD